MLVEFVLATAANRRRVRSFFSCVAAVLVVARISVSTALAQSGTIARVTDFPGKVAESGRDIELQVYDSAINESRLLTELTFSGSDYAAMDGKLYFAGRDAPWGEESTFGAELYAYDPAGTSNTAVDDLVEAPSGISIGPTYPNPASGRARIDLTIDHPQYVKAEVFDMLGRSV